MKDWKKFIKEIRLEAISTPSISTSISQNAQSKKGVDMVWEQEKKWSPELIRVVGWNDAVHELSEKIYKALKKRGMLREWRKNER